MTRGMERPSAVAPTPHPPAAVAPPPVLSGMVRPAAVAPAPHPPAAVTPAARRCDARTHPARRISHTRGKT